MASIELIPVKHVHLLILILRLLWFHEKKVKFYIVDDNKDEEWFNYRDYPHLCWLKWNKHIELVLNKCSKNIGIIAKVRHLLPTTHTQTLYLTLVEPYISYCNIVWSHPEPTTELDKLFKTQKKYCRLITFSKFKSHSKPLFKNLNILNVYQIYKY